MADEPDVLEEDDSVAPSTEAEYSALAEKLAALKARCIAGKIEYLEQKDEEGELYATILFQSGRNKRRRAIFNESRADSLLSVPFEKYCFLSGYEAICCYEQKVIEAGVRSSVFPSSILFRRMLSQQTGEKTSVELSPPESLHGRPAIELGPCTPEFIALSGRRPPQMSLRLKNVRASNHDQALAELRSYADSFFLAIDSIFGSTFTLERERRLRLTPPSRRPVGFPLEYPIAHYNSEAMSLYWYAKSARDMPLLRFLAFYQSIEFYFPRYSRTEARKRVAAIVKHPTFRPYRDDDLDRLISAVQIARSGDLGSERAQLRAVINECVGADEMRNYLTSSPNHEEHFSGKASKAKYHKIPLANKSADLRNDVADRIYDIRCKIVHTKNDHTEDDLRMILPFSEDAEYLLRDIDLVEFVAKSVLVASSGELN